VDPFFAEVLLGLERAANAQGYSVLLGHSEFDDAQQAANLKSLLEKGVDGLVINSPVVNDTFRDLVARLSVPCVLLQFYDPSLAVDFVHNDDRTAAYEAACYLIGLGHTRLACIAGLTYPEHTAHQRQQGYEQALREHGLPLRAEYFVVSDYSMQQGYDLFRQLWALPERPSALMTYSDLLALGALRAAADLGVSVPGDVSILGFDDIELAGFTVPRLTTVYQEKHLLGQMAFEQIRRRRADPSLPPQRHVVPAHLVVRESCAPPA
jgi:DNA-binding LacI/PurR family transcriptional regulator